MRLARGTLPYIDTNRTLQTHHVQIHVDITHMDIQVVDGSRHGTKFLPVLISTSQSTLNGSKRLIRGVAKGRLTLLRFFTRGEERHWEADQMTIGSPCGCPDSWSNRTSSPTVSPLQVSAANTCSCFPNGKEAFQCTLTPTQTGAGVMIPKDDSLEGSSGPSRLIHVVYVLLS